jgi:hypothetical protein
MATKIADLYANLSLKSSIQKDSQKANKSLGKLGTNMQSTAGKSRGMATSMGMAGGAAARMSAVALPLAAGLAVVGGATAKLVMDTGKMADKMLDLHERTGLATDTLQEYQQVTTMAGVEYDQFTKGIEVFNRKMIEAEQGTGRTVDVLKEMGVSVYDANGNMKSMEDLLPSIQSSLMGMEDVTKRNAYASQLFGRNTEAMLPILAMGEDGIRKAREEAHKLGMVQSNESLQSANKFRQSMESLTNRLKAAGTTIAVELIPVLNKYLIPAINDYLIPGFKVAAKVIKISLTPAIAGLKAAFAAIEPFIEPLQKALIKMYNVWVDVINRLQPYLSALGYDFEKLEHLSADAFKRNEKAMEDTARGAQNAADQYTQAAEQMQQANSKIPSWAGRGSAYTKKMLEATGTKNIDQLKNVPQEELKAAFDSTFGGRSVASNPAPGVAKQAVTLQNTASPVGMGGKNKSSGGVIGLLKSINQTLKDEPRKVDMDIEMDVEYSGDIMDLVRRLATMNSSGFKNTRTEP